MRNNHIVLRNGNIFCEHCGQEFELNKNGYSVGMFQAINKQFIKEHKNCKKRIEYPFINKNANINTEIQNEDWWWSKGERGISSETMYKYLTDILIYRVMKESHPHDPDDFKRCYFLIQAIPTYKNKLDRMKSVSKVWENIINNWDKLVELLQEQLQGKKNNMYEFMKSLGCN